MTLNKQKYKFRKKPVVIEAFQMTKERRWDNSEWPEWLHIAWLKNSSADGALFIDDNDTNRENLVIRTLEGLHKITWGDWIIQGIASELYPCKTDIFEKTYEKVEE